MVKLETVPVGWSGIMVIPKYVLLLGGDPTLPTSKPESVVIMVGLALVVMACEPVKTLQSKKQSSSPRF